MLLVKNDSKTACFFQKKEVKIREQSASLTEIIRNIYVTKNSKTLIKGLFDLY